MVENLRPAYLSLILGLVLAEEIGLSGLNAVMLVRASPSLSAHSLMSPLGPDMLRKVVIFLLAIAGAASGKTQLTMTLVGIGGACTALLANLGARAWHFLRWTPMSYTGPGSSLVAYSLAVLTGALLPFMGQRSIAVGGKGAIESVIRSSLLVAICFVLSDLNEIQKFLVVGSEVSLLRHFWVNKTMFLFYSLTKHIFIFQNCNQDVVNVVGALWWSVSLSCSLFLVRNIPSRTQDREDGEQFLIEDHTSPVGYKVPQLPNFEIDPVLAQQGNSCFSVNLQFAFGIMLAVIAGFAMAAFGLSDWEKAVSDKFDGFGSAVKDDFS